jgi:hypothetical protein
MVIRIPHGMAVEHGIVSGVRLGKVLMVGHAVPRGFNGGLLICVCVSGITQSTRRNAMLNVRKPHTVPESPS